MSAIVRWEDPPPRRGGPVHDWVAIAAALKKKPNRWAIVAVCDNPALAGSTARYIREGAYAPLLATGTFEAVARTVSGEYRVYARLVGES